MSDEYNYSIFNSLGLDNEDMLILSTALTNYIENQDHTITANRSNRARKMCNELAPLVEPYKMIPECPRCLGYGFSKRFIPGVDGSWNVGCKTCNGDGAANPPETY